ncbi:MAG: hypothetical protein JWQ12_2365 [Glaciihabitans sp.]|nr:hypothetical protein [Glaciihabitans sp.]
MTDPVPSPAQPAVSGADSGADEGDAAALLSRLRLIEDRPLESRAAAFAQVHDELQSRLDSGDNPRLHA